MKEFSEALSAHNKKFHADGPNSVFVRFVFSARRGCKFGHTNELLGYVTAPATQNRLCSDGFRGGV